MDRREDDLLRMPMWKSYLYHLQQQAPKPKKIFCQREVPNKPPFYGREFHGAMSREDADFLLTIGGEGSFLIRESQRAPGQYTLAIRFADNTKNFKLYYDGQHYVGEKRFDNIQDLVADGLITFYLESKAADYIAALSNESNYAESPYVAYNTFKKRQLAHPNRRTRSRNTHNRSSANQVAPARSASPTPGPSQTQVSRSESSGHESGRESGHSSSGSGGVGAATPRTGRAIIPVSSQFVEKRRSQAETNSTPQKPVATPAAIPEGGKPSPKPARPEPVVTSTGPPPLVTGTLQPYYQNSEQIALHQHEMYLRQQNQPLPPPPDSPPQPRPPISASKSTIAVAGTSATAATSNIPRASSVEPVSSTSSLDGATCAVEGRVCHSTNTEGPSAPSEKPSEVNDAKVEAPSGGEVLRPEPKPRRSKYSPAPETKPDAKVETRSEPGTPVPVPRQHSAKTPISDVKPDIPCNSDSEVAGPSAVKTKPELNNSTSESEPMNQKTSDPNITAVNAMDNMPKGEDVRNSKVINTDLDVEVPVHSKSDGKPKKSSPKDNHKPKKTQNKNRVSSTSRSPSPRSRVRDSKKTHSFKMLDFVGSPPGSPPPLGVHGGGDYKLSSVSWCTDYLEVMGCEKPHNFKLHTFKGPHWCDYCANFLWGLIAQGVKCQDCGLNAHKKCSEHVPNDCMPDMKYVKRMFGVDLTTLVKAQNTLIPAVVEHCVKEIEHRGIDNEGLYRVAGFHDDVETIKMSFDKDGELTDISEDSYEDINTITSVLKLYFRLLPIPLVTFEIYFRVIDTVRREDINLDVKLEKLKHMLAQLPPAHYHTLKYLMSHLHRVKEQQQKNMMSAENLAIVFAPTVLRSPETDPLTSLTAVKYERELIEVMIHHHVILFD